MRKIKRASSIRPELCGCGCGQVYVYLCDENDRDYARFSLAQHEWIPFGQECERIGRGEDPLGQPEPGLDGVTIQ